jgi:tetratricopeptide (TPR) repeat protein
MADDLDQAIALQQAGRLDLAESICRSILEVNSKHAGALNLIGLISHQKGNAYLAVAAFDRAVKLEPNRAEYLSNLASARLSTNDLKEAIEVSRSAIELQPTEIKPHIILALSYQNAKRLPEAESVARHISEKWPLDARGPKILGDILHAQKRDVEAIAAYRETLARSPDFRMVHIILGTLLLTSGDPAAAEPHLKQAVELQGDSIGVLLNYGSCLVQLGRNADAMRVYELARGLVRSDIGLSIQIATGLLQRGDLPEARKWLDAILRESPRDKIAQCRLADVCRDSHEYFDAISLYEQVIKSTPILPAYRGLADSLLEVNQIERAIAVMREAVQHFPDQPEAYVHLGRLLASSGDFAGAEAELRSALRIQPSDAHALMELANLLGGKVPAEDRDAIELALQSPRYNAANAGLYFGLAKVDDARGDFATAATSAERANVLMAELHRLQGRAHDRGEARRFVDRTIELFTPEFFRRVAGWGSTNERPVFVFGLPRSGTSLVEQILASHPKVFGAGECYFANRSFFRLPTELGKDLSHLDCIPHLTREVVQSCAEWHLSELNRLDHGKSDRIVDKMTDNYLLLGWLACTLPMARFIHCRRDLRDIALSCWLTNFERIRWANSIDDIVARIEDHERLMQYWRQVLPVSILEVDYERLVANQEEESRRLIDWLGLEWDPGCLEFHRTQRSVRTASSAQVRQPIYTRSIGRWRNYEQALRPLFERLEPLLKNPGAT